MNEKPGTHAIVAVKRDKMEIRTLPMGFAVTKCRNLKDAVMKACKEYAENTDEGRNILCYCGGKLDWYDFWHNVPNEICRKYGFEKLWQAETKEEVDWKEHLYEQAKDDSVKRITSADIWDVAYHTAKEKYGLTLCDDIMSMINTALYEQQNCATHPVDPAPEGTWELTTGIFINMKNWDDVRTLDYLDGVKDVINNMLNEILAYTSEEYELAKMKAFMEFEKHPCSDGRRMTSCGMTLRLFEIKESPNLRKTSGTKRSYKPDGKETEPDFLYLIYDTFNLNYWLFNNKKTACAYAKCLSLGSPADHGIYVLKKYKKNDIWYGKPIRYISHVADLTDDQMPPTDIELAFYLRNGQWMPTDDYPYEETAS